MSSIGRLSCRDGPERLGELDRLHTGCQRVFEDRRPLGKLRRRYSVSSRVTIHESVGTAYQASLDIRARRAAADPANAQAHCPGCESW